MSVYKDMTFDEERALYGSCCVEVIGCCFDGPADGESALKESRDVKVDNCLFNLRYPFWHNENLSIVRSMMTEKCRAPLWYSRNVRVTDTVIHGTKAFRECDDVLLSGCAIVSPEFGWSVRGIEMRDCSVESEYFMMRSERLRFRGISLKGKYSFQYISDSSFDDCDFDTKDSFWHARNVIVRNCVIKGEYMAWYCENVTFENCTIIGTQPLCYCKGLRLINCRMEGCDLSFEKSDVDAEVTTKVDSIKNPRSGRIVCAGVGETIMDDPGARGEIVVK